MRPLEPNLSPEAERSRATRAHQWIVFAILLFASIVRVAGLDRYPLPIHQDELSDIYDGYSLATTGADRSGERWPVLIRGIGPGDYHPGAYAYLAAIPAFFAGFSVYAGRLPAAFAGILTVWLVFLTTRRLFDDRVALIALLFAAFSPIHILYSRQAHQGVCLVPLFVMLSVYLLVRSENARKKGAWQEFAGLSVAGLFIGLSTNVYAGQRVTALLFALIAIAVIGWTTGVRRHDPRRAVGLITVFSIAAAMGAAPQLFVLATRPEQFFARASATVYPIECGFQWWGVRLLQNLALNLDPRYLFYSFGEHALLSVTRLNLASLPFLYIGLIAGSVLAIRRRSVALAWIPAGVLCSLAPSLITDGNPSSMRSSGVWALYPIVSAIGVMFIARGVRLLLSQGVTIRPKDSFDQDMASPRFRPVTDVIPRYRQGQIVTTMVAMLIVSAGVVDIGRYLSRPELHGLGAQNDFVRIGEWLNAHESDYERVYVDSEGMFGYLYVAAFSGMTPKEFREAPRKGTLRGLGWDEYVQFGRFRFESEQTAREQWALANSARPWLVIGRDLNPVILSAPHEKVSRAARP